jgi:hypothetical protein
MVVHINEVFNWCGVTCQLMVCSYQRSVQLVSVQLVRGYLSTVVSSIGVFNRSRSLDLLTEIKLEHHTNWHGSTELSFTPFYTPLGELGRESAPRT